ncbi:hypothetical protein TSMEX_004922 [Taenia solium]|eukprot:TsM_000408000 transcript=TsM_000408000 gene=TsM_000408000
MALARDFSHRYQKCGEDDEEPSKPSGMCLSRRTSQQSRQLVRRSVQRGSPTACRGWKTLRRKDHPPQLACQFCYQDASGAAYGLSLLQFQQTTKSSPLTSSPFVLCPKICARSTSRGTLPRQIGWLSLRPVQNK